MALINEGSLDNFSIRPADVAEVKDAAKRSFIAENFDLLSNIKTFSLMEQMRRSFIEAEIPFVPKPTMGGLGLKSFTLYKSFEGLMNIFNPQNEIYFVAWAWDLSSNPPYVYPAVGTEPGAWFHRMRKQDRITFIGDGINLYPKQEIKGGIGVHLEVWESDADIRKVGNTIKEVTDKVQNSELTAILSGLTSANPSTATVAAISQAVLTLSGIIGDILKKNSDDFVNLFEGYYSVDNWTIGLDPYSIPDKKKPTCEIILNRY